MKKRHRSYLCIDPKDERVALTAQSRSHRKGGDGWNPLADLDPTSPAFADDCASALTAAVNYEVRTARRKRKRKAT